MTYEQIINEIRLSNMEKKLLQFITNGAETFTSVELTDAVYEHKKRPPTARTIVVGTMNRLIRKLDEVNCGIIIQKEGRLGCYPAIFTVVRTQPT